MAFHLNWREIANLCEAISPQIAGAIVERVIVPERREFQAGFLKGEWILRLHSRNPRSPEFRDSALVLSVWPQRAYLGLISGKGPKAAESGTRAGFDLALNKTLSGAKLHFMKAYSGERTIRLRFTDFSLFLSLIPAHPEAFLVEDPGEKETDSTAGFLILARSRQETEATHFHPLAGAKAPPALELRKGVSDTLPHWMDFLNAELQREALTQRLQSLGTYLRAQMKHVELRLKQNQKTLTQAEGEANWQHYADLLKSVMANPPPLGSLNRRRAWDWTTETEVEIPGDPKLSLKEQVEKYYANSRRKLRRIEEARSRIDGLSTKLKGLRQSFVTWTELSQLVAQSASGGGLSELSRVRIELGSLEARYFAPTSKSGNASDRKAIFGWDGKVFYSKEGLPILVGKTKIENLELTFKVLRGNDLWFHVRGRPGAHAGILLRSKAHASLETLLDAASLTLYYSGGEKWGKTEVDYTHKKNVKRIKDSSEASYTQNKTLFMELDPTRLKRLLAQLDNG